MNERLSFALKNVETVLGSVDRASVDAACRMIAAASTIGVYGCGREGYQMRGLAMRLFHLGLNVGYVGETTMPALTHGGLLIVSSGPGGLATVNAHIKTAKSAGASVVLLTAQSDTSGAHEVDLVLTLQAQTMANDGQTAEDDILPMGSAYEGALFFLCEWIVADTKSILGTSAEATRARHTNME
ncbi:6-phospho-3-hexuloisomerase [Tateyamaria sp. Alg231-49]|uniref:6-phospho-3-hexuloisomerase n=1 Tax=Tateyamaria sp. Alg231-49 TaxID=1922219 RepID=UPI000D553DBA|nr:6-phospho-3-hexuloisomerase [Tateyamaria sp. Alg231-49]